MNKILSFCILLLPLFTHGVKCDDWIRHLQKDHTVWLIKKGSSVNSSFSILPVKDSSLVVAHKKDEPSVWNVESQKFGKWILIKNDYFGYIIEFDSKGNCVNTSGTGYNVYENSIYFNYDWKICEQVDKLLGKKIIKLDNVSISNAVKSLKPNDKKNLMLLVANANTQPFKPTNKINEYQLVDLCIGQTRFIEETLRVPAVKAAIAPAAQ